MRKITLALILLSLSSIQNSYALPQGDIELLQGFKKINDISSCIFKLESLEKKAFSLYISTLDHIGIKHVLGQYKLRQSPSVETFDKVTKYIQSDNDISILGITDNCIDATSMSRFYQDRLKEANPSQDDIEHLNVLLSTARLFKIVSRELVDNVNPILNKISNSLEDSTLIQENISNIQKLEELSNAAEMQDRLLTLERDKAFIAHFLESYYNQNQKLPESILELTEHSDKMLSATSNYQSYNNFKELSKYTILYGDSQKLNKLSPKPCDSCSIFIASTELDDYTINAISQIPNITNDIDEDGFLIIQNSSQKIYLRSLDLEI